MNQPFIYLVQDHQDENGRTLDLFVEKSMDVEESVVRFLKIFKTGKRPVSLSRGEFISWYCNFIPDSIRTMMDEHTASGFLWHSRCYFNYG